MITRTDTETAMGLCDCPTCHTPMFSERRLALCERELRYPAGVQARLLGWVHTCKTCWLTFTDAGVEEGVQRG